ncbi:ATP-binding protein [Sulfurisoma sediminicola]|uniref:histidine kinase n=1 Tax=Sulfurisoma sediminicola TaxID=1381557 RepID=A0A497XIH5_9PROT|nr:ATP-binding protein [Sulfurisoma sediminicola]RLJ67644.1 C4-dicarboxylate-specific signal transduction histidine kinase [Sulfurisoma sediminicola]
MNSVSPAMQPRRVRAAFMGSFAVALVVIMSVFATAIYLVEASVRDRDLAERSAAVAKLFEVKLEKDANLMRAVVRTMMSNAAIEHAFRNGDRGELERNARDLFEALRSDHRITHLYFTGPDRVNLYRLHTPTEHDDRIDRATMVQASSRKQPVHGLELGPLGTLTLRLVMPWRQGESDLGYVEVGEEIKHVIDEVRDNLAVDLLVLVDKRFVAQEQWQRGQTLMQRQGQGDWERFSGHVVQAQTMTRLPAALDERVLARLLGGDSAKIEDGGRSLHMAAVPLADAGGQQIGKLVILRDITLLESTFNGYMAAVVLLSLAVAAGVFGVFYVALQRVEKDYRRQHELEHRLLRVDTEHQRILQMEKLSALGTMVGSIAHQLNNPLVGVVNMAQLAEREIGEAGDGPARTRELLAEIRRAGEDCRGFVRRMLEFSKVSCFESKPTPMAALIEDTVLMFRQAEPRHLPVDVQLPAEPPVLNVDPILIRHALFNLLLNAAQATEGNAGIDIRLEPQPDPVSGSPGWSLAVADRGRGIAPEVMEKIFVPFFTTRADGTGLGLPVVLHVVLLHDGHVTASNRPDGGTQFAIWLPQ